MGSDLGGDDPDGIPQPPDIARSTGQLPGGPPGLRFRQDGVEVLERGIEVVGHHHRDGRQGALAHVHPGDLEIDAVVGLNLDQQVVVERRARLDEDVGEILVLVQVGSPADGGAGRIGEPESGADGQRRTGDEEGLQDLSSPNLGIKDRHCVYLVKYRVLWMR